jgi:hypothetical protein
VRVVARVGQQRELAVQEDDGIAILEEVLCARGSTRAGGKVVDEAHRLGFQGHSGTTRGDEHYPAAVMGMAIDKLLGQGRVCVEVFWWRLVGEVVAFAVVSHLGRGVERNEGRVGSVGA